MRRFALAFTLLLISACESSPAEDDGDGETGGSCDAALVDGCECDPEDDQCSDGLECMESGGSSTCGCPDPEGLGCPCGGADDCGGDLECTEGTCTQACGPDTDFDTDIENCGECGRACADAEGSCEGGVCFGKAELGECFVPGGDVSCHDVCGDAGAVCVNACPSGWVGYDSPGCMDTAQEGTCDDLIANPFASTACCCAEQLD